MVAENLDRLPKWAQQRIRVLESDVDFWKKKATAGPEDSNTFISQGLGDDDTPLGKSPNVRFFLRPREGVWRNSIDVRVNAQGRLQVSGATSFVVLPRSSNLIELELER